jgi:AmmeMemoRadiSam system protein B/AmmeMemoRadiSam system protein A
MLEGYLEKVPAPDRDETNRLIATVVPHAGYAYSGFTAAHAYKAIQQRRPKRVLMIGPSHYAGFRGLSFGDYASYETPLGRVPVDRAGRALLLDCPLVRFHPEAHQREHSVDIQVPFLQVIFPESTPVILPLLVGHLEEEDYPVLAECLRKVLDSDTVLVVSSDFTHYGPRFGYVPFPYESGVANRIQHLDQGACDKILGLDRKRFLSYYETTGITICGCRPIALLLELLPEDTRSRNLFYTTSGQLTGDFRNSVSYYSLAFTRDALWEPEDGGNGSRPVGENTMKKGKNPSQGSEADEGSLTLSEKSTLLKLARDTIQEYVQTRKTLDPRKGRYEITPKLRENRGAFVTLKKEGTLRGCIGYIQPIEPLFETVQQNAINAAARDSRFSAVKPKELSSIEIEISALTVPEPVSSYRKIVLGKHGIILKQGSRQAVFLPQVAPEQGWDLAETLRHLSLKAGLSGDAWRDPETEFLVFTAEVFKEE